MKKFFISIVIMSLGSSFQLAKAAPGDVALGLKAGTLGAGVEFTIEAADQINFRLGGNYFKLNREVNVEGNDYDLDLKLNSFTALADWFVADSAFRITGGVMINKNGLNGTALPSNTYEIDGTLYTGAEVGVLAADVNFKTLAPYIGIGWGNPLSDDSNWSFSADVGIVFSGKPMLDITSTGGTLSDNAMLLNNIEQAEQSFKDTDEINYLKYYPVISLGINYRF